MIKPQPEYPMIAQQHNIRGIARVKVTVERDGTVSAVKEVGGNPVLLDALTRAVKKWKYERTNKTSVETVSAKFGM